jgi:hypothetical protein
MTMEELRALKSELQQLRVELTGFRKELLTLRTEELGQLAPASVRKSDLRTSEISMLDDEQHPVA